MIIRVLATASLLSLMVGASPAMAAFSSKEVVGSKFDAKVQTKTGACVRTKWDGGNDVCGAAKEAPAPIPEPAPYVMPPAPKPVVKAAPPAPPVPKTVIKKEARTIYFDSGKSTVSPGGEKKLDQLASVLKGAKDIERVNIVGYADPMGNKEYNYALSERRAEAVQSYLNNQGYIKTSVAKTKGVGEDEASANCGSKMKKSKKVACLLTDRKVEVEVVYSTQQ